MHYFTYITRLKDGEKYYVGRHCTNKDPQKDNYKGSGKWVRSIKDKSLLDREIIEFYQTEDELKQAETKLLSEHVGKPNCMNFNERSVGFSSINNPAKSPEERLKRSERTRGENNPMFGRKHTPEALAKISERSKLYNPSRDDPEVKKKISKQLIGKNKGKVRSQELRDFFSKQRKEQYANGTRQPVKSFLGKHHTDEHKLYMSELAKNKPDVECEHCGKKMKKQLYVRWHGKNCKDYTN